jgi:hypothetical protein
MIFNKSYITNKITEIHIKFKILSILYKELMKIQEKYKNLMEHIQILNLIMNLRIDLIFIRN